MCWIKDTQALHNHAAGNSLDAEFDDLYPDGFIKQDNERHAQAWDRYCKELEELRREAYRLAQQAVLEIAERDSAKPRSGMKPYLKSYDEYKRIAVSRWMTFLAKRATNAELAIEFGFCKQPPTKEGIAAGFYKKRKKAPCLLSGARRVRVVKSGAKGKSGASRQMPPGRIIVGKSAVQKYNRHRCGSMVFPWVLNPLCSPEEFEEWAKDAAQMTLDELLQRGKEMDRSAYD